MQLPRQPLSPSLPTTDPSASASAALSHLSLLQRDALPSDMLDALTKYDTIDTRETVRAVGEWEDEWPISPPTRGGGGGVFDGGGKAATHLHAIQPVQLALSTLAWSLLLATRSLKSSRLLIPRRPETREHLLLVCPLYNEARNLLLKHLRLRKTPAARVLLGNPLYRDALLKFLNRTGRFPRPSKPPEVEKREKE